MTTFEKTALICFEEEEEIILFHKTTVVFLR